MNVPASTNSAPRPFIFISIPRAASSTVHYLLGLKGPKDRSAATDIGITDNHAPCDTILARYGAAEFERRFKFAFVRNPWDRCVSWFFHHVAEPPYSSHSFKSWIDAGMPHHWNVQNGTVYRDVRTPLEQFRFITDAGGRIVLDFVGRSERFGDDMAHVARVLGLRFPPQQPRINRAGAREHADYRVYYDDVTAARVGKMLETDVRMFEYDF